MSALATVLTVGFLFIAVFGSLAFLAWWAAEAADLLWMLARRRLLVGLVILITALVLTSLTLLIAPIGTAYAVRYLLVLLALPMVSRPLCDLISYRLNPETTTSGWRRHVFAQARCELRARYQSDPQTD